MISPVRVSMARRVPSSSSAAHRTSPPSASAPPDFTTIGAPATRPVRGLSLTTRSSSVATQTRPRPTTTSVGPRPTAIGPPMGCPERASIRVTVPSPKFATHTDPAPTAIAPGSSPTPIGAPTGFPDWGSMRLTVPSPVFATQTEPALAATALGESPTGTRGRHDAGHRRGPVAVAVIRLPGAKHESGDNGGGRERERASRKQPPSARRDGAFVSGATGLAQLARLGERGVGRVGRPRGGVRLRGPGPRERAAWHPRVYRPPGLPRAPPSQARPPWRSGRPGSSPSRAAPRPPDLADLRDEVRGQRGRIGDVRPQFCEIVLAPKRHVATEGLEYHAAEGIDVGAAVDRVAADLLRRHVVERSNPLSRAGQPAVRARALG